jgi:hypothetical protein
MRTLEKSLIHWKVRPPNDDSSSFNSLKQRMTRAEPLDRAISTCPTGSWLDGLRTSFDPESGPQPEPKPKAGLFGGRLRSV